MDVPRYLTMYGQAFHRDNCFYGTLCLFVRVCFLRESDPGIRSMSGVHGLWFVLLYEHISMVCCSWQSCKLRYLRYLRYCCSSSAPRGEHAYYSDIQKWIWYLVSNAGRLLYIGSHQDWTNRYALGPFPSPSSSASKSDKNLKSTQQVLKSNQWAFLFSFQGRGVWGTVAAPQGCSWQFCKLLWCQGKRQRTSSSHPNPLVVDCMIPSLLFVVVIWLDLL